MPFPPSLSQNCIARVNLFYSLSQIFAICGVLIMGLDEAFLVLFPIQIAAFLLTLVRKDVISAATWHLLYGSSLLLPYVYLLVVLQPVTAMELLSVGAMVSLLRFRYRVNKYLLWYLLNVTAAIWREPADRTHCPFLVIFKPPSFCTGVQWRSSMYPTCRRVSMCQQVNSVRLEISIPLCI
jgi:hypothetical protein